MVSLNPFLSVLLTIHTGDDSFLISLKLNIPRSVSHIFSPNESQPAKNNWEMEKELEVVFVVVVVMGRLLTCLSMNKEK